MKLFITVDNFFRGLESLCELAVCEVFVDCFTKVTVGVREATSLRGLFAGVLIKPSACSELVS